MYTAATVVKMTALGLINLMVVLGNSLVIAAVLTTRKLRTVTNIFIVSLACADLALGAAVMPFSISYEVTRVWLWGTVWCSMWLAIDVWLCTASILSLCAISLDRYIAVTHPIRYPSLVSPFRGKVLVMAVWILSFVICLPPLLGWNDGSQEITPTTQTPHHNTSTDPLMTPRDIMFEYTSDMKSGDYFYEGVITNFSVFGNYSDECDFVLPVCELTPTKGYRIYAAMGSFYLPSLIMMFFYLRIYLTAVKTAASIRSGVLLTRASNESAHARGDVSDDAIQLRVHRGGSTMSHKRNCASDSTRFPSGRLKGSTRSQTTGSTRSDSSHISNSSVRTPMDSLLEKNQDNNNSCKTKHRTLTFWAHLSKRKNKTRRGVNLDRKKGGEQQPEVLNLQADVAMNGSGTFRSKAVKSLQNSCLKRSPKKCKLLKDSRSSGYHSKGHARKFHREAKAAKTLAIIVGAFIVCWCPFFTIYLLGAFCHGCVSDVVFSVFFWLGYINSALNPCIYALFARDFRGAFRRIILCKRRKGFNQAARADFVTGTRKTISLPQDFDSLSD